MGGVIGGEAVNGGAVLGGRLYTRAAQAPNTPQYFKKPHTSRESHFG